MTMKRNSLSHRKWAALIAGLVVLPSAAVWAQADTPDSFAQALDGDGLPEIALPEVDGAPVIQGEEPAVLSTQEAEPDAAIMLPEVDDMSVPDATGADATSGDAASVDASGEQPVAMPDEAAPPAPKASRNTSIQMVAGQPKMASLSAEPPPARLSIGNFGVSIMYTKEDINNLRQVLAIYENQQPKTQEVTQEESQEDADLLAELLRAAKQQDGADGNKLAEMTALPSFYLGTILYRQADDWAVWINRIRLDAENPADPATGLTVKAINRNEATLVWKPSNIVPAFRRWKQLEEHPEMRANRHRVASAGSVTFNEETGEFTITIRPHQTFFGDSMQVLEGKTGFISYVAPAVVPVNSVAPGPIAIPDAGPQPLPGSEGFRRKRLNEREAAAQLIDNTLEAGEMLGIEGTQ